jgi:hypothetical protein
MTCPNAMLVEEMFTLARFQKAFHVQNARMRASGAARAAKENPKNTSVQLAATRANSSSDPYKTFYVITLKKWRASSFCSPENAENASTSSFSTKISFAITERSFFVSNGAMLLISPVLYA